MRPPTDDLEFNSLPPQLGGLVLAQPAVMARALGEADPEQAVAAALLDDLAVQISVGHGLVYTLDVQADQQDQRNATALRNRQAIVPQYFLPNRVIACDIARDGEIAWMLGAGTPVSQGSHLQARFDAARFAAAPLPVGDDLLLPYWFDKDLYIAFVDPRTGDVREDLHLCTLRDTADAWRYSLPPAVDETLAFIPTNGGLLLAVDLLGRSIVWASRYTRQPYEPARPETLWNTLRSSQSRFASTMHWLPGPPVVAGAAVLLAAPDSDELLAFERSTGRILWSCPRADASYIVAADADHVWLAGPQVTKVAVRDGSIVWSADVGPATGRAVVSGGRVLVPTSRALVALDAETGRPLQDQPLPEDHAPLGNLLCSGGALYSIDTVEIRKFPDLQRSYEESCRLQQAAPEEPGPGIRLAWMELLRHQPQRVLEVLKRIDSSKADPRQAAQIAHLHVQALIEGVRGGAWPAGAGQARLEQAMSIATSPRDRVEAALALVELLHANGQDREAFRRGWDSLQHLAVNELVTCGSGWRRPASALLEESLSELLEEMSEDDVAALTAELHPDVLDEEATSKRREDVMLRLDRIAEGPSVGNWSYLAALKIGRWKVHLREYERAEYYLHLAADLAGTPEEQAAALHALGQLYARDDLDLPGLLEPVARRLISTYPTVEIGGRPAAEIAREWLDAVAEAKPAAASFKGPATTSDEWHEGALASTHIVDFGGMLPVRLGDSVILMSAARTLVACRATDGKRLWEAPLRMLTEPMFEPEVLVRRQVAVRCRGHSRDQILLVNTETALHAVGLVTGRRLWYVPFEYPVEGWSQSADYYDIAGGRVVVRQGPHRVQLLRSCDGRVEWEARVADMRVVQVRIHDRRVVLMGESGRRVGVLDLASGAPVFTTELDNDAPPLGYEPPVAAGAVWGLNLSALVGTDLLDGRERFRQRLPEGFSATAVFSAGEDYVVAGGAMGHVMVVDSRSGEVLATRQLPFASLGVRGGVAAGERLVFWGLTQGDSMQILQLAAMDLPSGEAAWRTGDLGVPLDWRTNLSMLRSRIPLVYDPPGPKREALPEFITGTGAALVFLDKQTGQVADLPIPLPDAGAQYTGECLLLPHRIVLGTETRAVRIALPGLVGE
jgi:outer membrane protein assembly factor BamB